MAGLEILFACLERGLALRCEPLRPVRGLKDQGHQKFVLSSERQGRQDLVLRRKSDLGGPDLYRRLGRVFASNKAEKSTGSGNEPYSRFLSAITHGSFFGPI